MVKHIHVKLQLTFIMSQYLINTGSIKDQLNRGPDSVLDSKATSEELTTIITTFISFLRKKTSKEEVSFPLS